MLQHSSDNANKIAVAMSGGVDSSVAAMLLQQQGSQIIGISMQVWDYRNNGGSCSRATCCAPSDFLDARRVADKIGIPYYVFDFEHTFREQVIQPFVAAYQAGRTPNPCVECNNKVKFRALRDRVLSLGFAAVATGHYAQILEVPGGGYCLARGCDAEKDQSYFLYGLSQEELSATKFPIGHLTKREVRKLAAQAGLVTAEKEESQDICFVSSSIDEFLVQLGTKRRTGVFVTRDGRVLGQHDGIHQFTVGQRRGLALGGSDEPLYVLELRAEDNSVVVGVRSELEQREFYVLNCRWSHPSVLKRLEQAIFPQSFSAIAQVRHRHSGVPVRLTMISPSITKAEFEGPWSVISPGQAAVFFEQNNQNVLGGGEISRSIPQHLGQTAQQAAI
ncbi:MAG: tRNA 2-thiouridine(34) synthase MnmA [Oligoflexia bacterium]|nr:tRNA 2-thiouridine(34) synthase MnmA [Oligoflexia bacterium]